MLNSGVVELFEECYNTLIGNRIVNVFKSNKNVYLSFFPTTHNHDFFFTFFLFIFYFLDNLDYLIYYGRYYPGA